MSTPSKPTLKKDGTMAATAKDGVQYLKESGEDALLRYLKRSGVPTDDPQTESGRTAEPPSDKPSLTKAGTMLTTAKEGEAFLDSQGGVDDDAKTRAQQEKIESLSREEPEAKKPRLVQHNTIKATTKEAESLLGGEKLGETRAETKHLAEKPAVARAGTMLTTAADGEEWLKRGVADTADKPGLKKAGTMQQTAKEGEEWLTRGSKDDDKPTLSKEGTMQKTAKEGAEWVARDTTGKK